MAKPSTTFQADLEAAGQLRSYEACIREKVRAGMDERKARLEASKEYRAIANAAAKTRERVEKGQLLPGAPLPLPAAELSDFGGRTASEVEVIRWVARNLGVSGVKPDECPDPTAWGLLRSIREGNLAEGDFWKTIYTRVLPSRMHLQGEDDEDVEEDGGHVLELIDSIRAISSKHNGEAA